jgi:hypothetical protein
MATSLYAFFARLMDRCSFLCCYLHVLLFSTCWTVMFTDILLYSQSRLLPCLSIFTVCLFWENLVTFTFTLHSTQDLCCSTFVRGVELYTFILFWVTILSYYTLRPLFWADLGMWNTVGYTWDDLTLTTLTKLLCAVTGYNLGGLVVPLR